jgi:hypothetical protein
MNSKKKLNNYYEQYGNYLKIDQDNTNNSRGLNRFPDAPKVAHPDTGYDSEDINQYPEWWHRSNKSKFRKGYYHPKSYDDSVYRSKAGPVQENTKVINYNNFHIRRDPFYDSNKTNLYNTRPGEKIGNDRLSASLMAKNVIRPLGNKRSYIPTKEELTGEIMPNGYNNTSTPRSKNISVLNTFHGINLKTRKLPNMDGKKNNRFNTTQKIYSNYENYGKKSKSFLLREKNRNTIGDSSRSTKQPYIIMDKDKGKNGVKLIDNTFIATKIGQNGSNSNHQNNNRMNIFAKTKGNKNGRIINNPDYNQINRTYLNIRNPTFQNKIKGNTILYNKKNNNNYLSKQNEMVKKNRFLNNSKVDYMTNYNLNNNDHSNQPLIG